MILIVDGQGGGLGKSLIREVKEKIPNIEIIAVGTNSVATTAMLKAGADYCATGENAVVYNAGRVNAILGGIGIISANSMLGEISPAMSSAITSCTAHKFLIPMNRCNIHVSYLSQYTLPELISETVNDLQNFLKQA